MSTFAISFHLATNSTYGDRYSTLMEQIRACRSVWLETTSFALVETPETAEALADRLYYQSQVSAVTDIILVINVTADPGVSRGAIQYPATLRALMPNVVQK